MALVVQAPGVSMAGPSNHPGLNVMVMECCEIFVDIGDEWPGTCRPACFNVVAFDVFHAVTRRLIVEAKSLVVVGGPEGAAASQTPTDGVFRAFGD